MSSSMLTLIGVGDGVGKLTEMETQFLQPLTLTEMEHSSYRDSQGGALIQDQGAVRRTHGH